MTVLCPGCQRRIRVPPEKAGLPNLRAKCAGCGTVFAVAQAAAAPEAVAAPEASRPAPVASVDPAPPAAAPSRPASAAPPSVRSSALPPRVTPPAAPPAAAASPRVAASAASPPPLAAAASPRAATPPAARPPARSRGRVNWRLCANHPAIPSEGICGKCGRGLCADCVTRQGSAAICPACDALCVPVAEQERREEQARARVRPLLADLGKVFAYPLCDKVAFVIFAIFVGVFGLAAAMAGFGGGIGAFISQGLLYAYAFTALNRVAAGDHSTFMPQLSDWTDLVQPMRAGLAAMLISSGPLLGLTFLYTGSEVLASVAGPRLAEAVVAPTPTPEPAPTLPPELAAALEQDEYQAAPADAGSEEAGGAETGSAAEAEAARAQLAALEREMEEEARVPAWVVLAFLLALVWQLVYSPIALVAAAISRSFVATLNPVAGLTAIRRMGSVYWVAMAVYTGIVIVQAVVVGVFGLVPVAGKLINGFVQSYTFLAIGCLLGLAVFKKAPELGLD